MSNPHCNHKISQVDFVRNYLSTNSMKQFWRGIDESKISTYNIYSVGILQRLAQFFSEAVYSEDSANILSRIGLTCVKGLYV